MFHEISRLPEFEKDMRRLLKKFKTLEEIKKTIDEHKSILKERFKINSIGICGSYVRKAEKAKSDIDILVDFYETIDLLEFVELEDFLSEILRVKVDLVMKETLKPRVNYPDLTDGAS